MNDHIVQANFVQFDDDFTGLGTVVGMLLQCTFKSFCHSVSIQAWANCFYSGFSFSHYDLPFPTRYGIPYVRSGLYQLVIRVKGFRVSAHDLDSHLSVLSIGVDTTLSLSRAVYR